MVIQKFLGNAVWTKRTCKKSGMDPIAIVQPVSSEESFLYVGVLEIHLMFVNLVIEFGIYLLFL